MWVFSQVLQFSGVVVGDDVGMVVLPDVGDGYNVWFSFLGGGGEPAHLVLF